MSPLLDHILTYLEEKNPAHGTRLRRKLAGESAEYFEAATRFFSRYASHIESTGKTIEYGLDCYLNLVANIVHERMEFLRTGRYANTSFAEVERCLYLKPELFEYHMHGLVFAQFLWPDQAARFQFFSQHIGRYLARAGSYLEIGGGHALYIAEAMRQASAGTRFSLVDISPTSMELAQGITRGLSIDFRLMNIFDYAPDVKFDFITMGEVIEHVEDPLALLVKVRGMLAPGGTAFITTPANAPTIDHIYLFNSADEIRNMLVQAGLRIVSERVAFGEDVSDERARKLKVAVMFAAFVSPEI